MSDEFKSIVILVGAVMIFGSVVYLRVRAGPGRTWHLIHRFLSEVVKEYGPPGLDPLKKVTPATWVVAVLLVGILLVLHWYKQSGSPLAHKIDAIYEFAFGFLLLCLIGYFVVRKVLGDADEDDDAKQ